MRENGQFGYAQDMVIRGADVVTPGMALGAADVRIKNGEIAVGQIADLVLVDDSLTPRMTIVGGEAMRS